MDHPGGSTRTVFGTSGTQEICQSAEGERGPLDAGVATVPAPGWESVGKKDPLHSAADPAPGMAAHPVSGVDADPDPALAPPSSIPDPIMAPEPEGPYAGPGDAPRPEDAPRPYDDAPRPEDAPRPYDDAPRPDDAPCPDDAPVPIPDGESLRQREGAWTSVMAEAARHPHKSPRDMTNKELGERGEMLAAHYLAHRGYAILERNMRNFCGEADIVARQDDCVVLVEVKTRLAMDKDEDVIPELAVNQDKQRRYRNIALRYLEEHPEYSYIRFDVIAIKVEAEHHANLRHLVGAFVCDL